MPSRLCCTIAYRAKYRHETLSDSCNLAIAAIIKNEGKYIEEWIRYHIAVGVQKFYLYDNGSTDNTKEVLDKYIEAGIVELTYYPGVAKQLPAYNDAIKRHRSECKYIAFIDADEFLFSCDKQKNVCQNILDLMGKYPSAGGLAINWRMFGSSGFESKPVCGGVLDNFLYRAVEDGRGNACIKTVVNPRKVFRFKHVHYPTYIYGVHSIDEDGAIVEGWKHTKKNIKTVRINHYFTKSKEEWIERRKQGKADYKDPLNVRSLDEFYLHDNNDIYDDGMLFYVEKMKQLDP